MTDMTLSCLDKYNPTARQLYSLCELLFQIGANYTEISVGAFNKLGFLPSFGSYILKCDNISQINKYPQFDMYVCRKSGKFTPEYVISEIQVNDIREIHLLSQYTHLKNVRLKGLDDILSHDYMTAFDLIKQIFNNKVQLCVQNRYDLATATTVEWLLSGGSEAAVSFAGIGGYAALEEVYMALRLEIRRKPNMDFSVFSKIKALIEEITCMPIPKNKPIIGDNIFHVEAGIHIDGIIKNPKMYEPFQPELVGNSRKLVLGKHSGKNSIIAKLKELGLASDCIDIKKLLSEVRSQSIIFQKSLSDEDFINLYKKIAGPAKGGEDT
jgi:homocitrate synthase NifV